jgi:drug/metabolite transporter (DMT)-like permease
VNDRSELYEETRRAARPGSAPIRLPLLAGAGSQVLLGSSFAVSAAVTRYPFAVGQAGRYLLAGAAFLLLARVRRIPLRRPGWRDLARLAILAAAGLVAFNLCLLAALRHAAPSAVAVILGGTPLVLALLGPVLARRRGTPVPAAGPARRRQVLLGAAVVLLGVALVEGAGRASAIGLALAAGTLVCEVAFTLLAEPLLPRYGPFAVSAYVCLLAVPELAVVAPLSDHALRWPTPAELTALLFLGGALTTLAFLAWYRCVAEVGADRAGLLTGLVPVSSLLTGTLLGRDHLGVVPLVGALAVGVGVLTGLARQRGRVAR